MVCPWSNCCFEPFTAKWSAFLLPSACQLSLSSWWALTHYIWILSFSFVFFRILWRISLFLTALFLEFLHSFLFQISAHTVTQLMLYAESEKIMVSFWYCVAISIALSIANSSATLLVWGSSCGTCSLTFRTSSTPKYTPKPALASAVPLLPQAPSVKMTRMSLSGWSCCYVGYFWIFFVGLW